jgi:hypothetical protein
VQLFEENGRACLQERVENLQLIVSRDQTVKGARSVEEPTRIDLAHGGWGIFGWKREGLHGLVGEMKTEAPSQGDVGLVCQARIAVLGIEDCAGLVVAGLVLDSNCGSC